jgi:hypothetical protein
MEQQMVVLPVELRPSVAAGTRDHVDNNPQSIHIRKDASERNQPAITDIVSGFCRHDPTCEQMCYW